MSNDLGAMIAADVLRAEQDYQNVRARSLSLVTVSGGLVVLVSGLLAIATGTTHKPITSDAKIVVGIGLVAFVIAAILALLINLPAMVTVAPIDDLRDKVDNQFDSEGWDKQIASLLVDYLESLRQNNGRNAVLLMCSIGFEILGIAGIAASAILILAHT